MNKKNRDNPWLDSKNSPRIEHYISNADFLIVERQQMLKILVDIFSYHFDNPENLKLMDLGCGNGIVTEKIVERYPDNNFCLMDGSPTMIEKAKENFKGGNFIFIHKSFEEYLSDTPENYAYDFIYSSFAIHHLDFLSKVKMFSRIFRELRYNGLFLIMDGVSPVSEKSNEWQVQMRKDWIREKVNTGGIEDKQEKLKELLNMVDRRKEVDIPSGLNEQMAELTKIGFRDVDCFFKYGFFALFGGSKWIR